MNVLANVMSYYNSGENDIFHFVLGRILTNLDLLLNATIYDVAEYCSASPATISRLALKLGYKNYSDLKHNISDAVEKYSMLNRITPSENKTSPEQQTGEYISAIKYYAESFYNAVESLTPGYIEKIADALHNAQRVSFYSFGYCSTELHLQINLMLDGKETILCQRSSDQLNDIQRLDKNSMIVLIAPINLDSAEVEQLLIAAGEKGAKSLLITDHRSIAARTKPDYFLGFDGAQNAVDMHFLYMFVDIINVCYRSRYIDTKLSLLPSGRE